MELAINDIFSQIQQGKDFSKTKCHCGCGIDKAATDLIHSIRDRMLELDLEVTGYACSLDCNGIDRNRIKTEENK